MFYLWNLNLDNFGIKEYLSIHNLMSNNPQNANS